MISILLNYCLVKSNSAYKGRKKYDYHMDSHAIEDHGDHDHDELLPTIELLVTNAQEKRAEIKKAFNESFDLYEHLFNLVSDEGHFMRADPLRHPLIFYHGHTAAFYMNKLISARVLKNSDRIDAEIESLVAIGVDEMSW